ncbi:alpha/beta hydrolase family protein [Demetria terragena]|uniref:alpha/beta hydrolase family protein n=1 Tax=Demetria terragena TaxID=63959 RepID=UPI00037DA679|nr:alpha/beta fold hydrolase [Demetria terragena]
MAEDVRFPGSSGTTLGGVIDLPEGEVRGWGVFAHGFTLGKDFVASSRICKQLASEGIGMLRFDSLGLGDSDGDWGDGSFSHKVADVKAAVAFMNSTDRHVDVLVGHSWGGAAVIAAGHQLPSIRAVAAVAAPSDPSHVEHQYDDVVNHVLRNGEARWLAGGKALTLKRAFIEDVRRADLTASVKDLGHPLLILHSPTDKTVGIDNAAEIFNIARHPRSFVSLEGSDHLLTRRGQAERAARVISAWADPYLSG